MKWIKFTPTTMPPNDGDVLIFMYADGGEIAISSWYDENSYMRKSACKPEKYPYKMQWRENHCEQFGNITHWMPLPEPPC